MQDILNFLESKFLVWSMILTRVAGLFLATPFYMGWFIPILVKVFLAIFLSWLVLYSIPPGITIPLSTSPWLIVNGMINNFLIGALIGFIAYMLMSAVMSAGGIFSIQMGFMMASSFDPTAPDIPLLGNYMYMLALYVFVSLKGHIIFYTILLDSFKKFPVNLYGSHFNIIDFLIKKSEEMFVIALQLGITIIAFMLIVTVLLGIVSRLMPQINVFMVGIPLKILVGLIIFLGMIPIWTEALEFLTSKMINYAQNFISR